MDLLPSWRETDDPTGRVLTAWVTCAADSLAGAAGIVGTVISPTITSFNCLSRGADERPGEQSPSQFWLALKLASRKQRIAAKAHFFFGLA
jgi:hypothetical protein